VSPVLARQPEQPVYLTRMQEQTSLVTRFQVALATLARGCRRLYDEAVPKLDPPANRIRQFMLGPAFQAEFDKWAAEVEKEQGGKLEIVHQEIVQNTMLVITWRVVPKRSLARPRHR
jgi:hypothetical protein